MAKKLEKEFELINRIIEQYWNRAVGLANAESLMAYWTVGVFVSEKPHAFLDELGCSGGGR